MKDKEDFKRLKATFIEKNAAFIRAVKQTTDKNYSSLENKVLLSSLRLQSVESYHILLDYIRTAKSPSQDTTSY